MGELERQALISAFQQVTQQGICQANKFISPVKYRCCRNLQEKKKYTEVDTPYFENRKIKT